MLGRRAGEGHSHVWQTNRGEANLASRLYGGEVESGSLVIASNNNFCNQGLAQALKQKLASGLRARDLFSQPSGLSQSNHY
jgi:hypothetical protein